MSDRESNRAESFLSPLRGALRAEAAEGSAQTSPRAGSPASRRSPARAQHQDVHLLDSATQKLPGYVRSVSVQDQISTTSRTNCRLETSATERPRKASSPSVVLPGPAGLLRGLGPTVAKAGLGLGRLGAWRWTALANAFVEAPRLAPCWLVALEPSQSPPRGANASKFLLDAQQNTAPEHDDLSSCARRPKGTAGDSNLAQPRLLTCQCNASAIGIGSCI